MSPDAPSYHGQHRTASESIPMGYLSATDKGASLAVKKKRWERRRSRVEEAVEEWASGGRHRMEKIRQATATSLGG